ncbi:MAG: hypothetical protein H6684_01190 [Deltaproteobacteria bacterium]|nr:hypothetical protein [Deltaproteobacteria bacterium]
MQNIRTVFLFLFISTLVFALLGAVSCSGGDDDDESPDDDMSDDDTVDDDETADDDNGDDDDSADDEASDDDASEETIPFSCDKNGVFESEDTVIWPIVSTQYGSRNIRVVENTVDKNLYLVADVGTEIYLYSRSVEAAAGAPWHRALIDCMATDPDMVVDRRGNLHLIYGDLWNGNLMYATNRNGWHREVIDDAGEFYLEHSYIHAAIDLDADDRAHVFYFHTGTLEARYAVRSDEGWDIETVKPPFQPPQYRFAYIHGMRPEMTLEENGNVHVVYDRYQWNSDDPNHQYCVGACKARAFVYARRENGIWTTAWGPGYSDSDPVIESSAADIQVDSNANVLVVFEASSDLYLAKWTGSGWDLELIGACSGADSDIDFRLAKDDTPHLAYRGQDYVTRRNGEWVFEEMFPQGERVISPSLILLASGGVFVAGRPGTNEPLRVSRKPVGAQNWSSEIVAQSWNSGVGRLLIDAKGDPIWLTYESLAPDSPDENVATLWRFEEETLTQTMLSGPGAEAVHLTYVMDAEGQFYAARLHGKAGDTRSIDYAAFDDANWTTSTLTVEGYDFLLDSRILLNSDDHPWIVATAWKATFPTEAIVTFKLGDNGWTQEAVPIFEYSAPGIVLIDKNDNLHFVFERPNGPADQLAYMTNAQKPWNEVEVEVIDEPSGNFGDLGAALIDADDIIHIAYTLKFPNVPILHYAYGHSGSWTVEEVDIDNNRGCQRPQMHLDASGDPTIVCEFSGDDLAVLSRHSGAWTKNALPKRAGITNPDTMMNPQTGQLNLLYEMRDTTDLMQTKSADQTP